MECNFKMKRRTNQGVTFIEMIVALAIFTTVVALGVGGANLMKGLQKQWSLLQIQREAQLDLYNISRDIRNARSILSISTDTLVLQAYNTRLGFDSATSD